MKSNSSRWVGPGVAALALLLGHGVLLAELFDDAAGAAKPSIPTPEAQAPAREVFTEGSTRQATRLCRRM